MEKIKRGIMKIDFFKIMVPLFGFMVHPQGWFGSVE